jgi:hypothetical protein
VNEAFTATAAEMAAAADGRAAGIVASGRFHDGAHETMGTATVHHLAGGGRLLRLTDFRTSNGPDVRVYLVAASDVLDDDTVKAAGFVDLGALDGNVGDQNYDIPADVDLERYRSVTIWCRRFAVAFGTAPLVEAGAPAPAAPAALSAGRFHSVAHETRGLATVYQLPGGERVLRLTDFETSNGPDVRLYLVAADDATDDDTVKNAGFVDVGALEGNVGDQNYELPPDLDLGRYRTVTVWCRRFGVNFGTAPLAAPHS